MCSSDLILRPPRTLEEEFQQSLEEEALLQTIEDIPLCPGCSRKVKPEWIVCPTCETKLKKKCTSCKAILDLSWNICPYCGAKVAPKKVENTPLEELLPSINPTLFNDLDDQEQDNEVS